MFTGAIIQARMTSTRLPKKVLKELPFGSGETVLSQVIKRVKASTKIEKIIIATTTDKEDDEVEAAALKENVVVFRGSTENVLERFYLAAKENNLDTIVRITSDCPCIDPAVIDDVLFFHYDEKNDYTSNTQHRSFPHGLDVEAFSFIALQDAYENAKEKYETEHVTPYIYRTHRDKFRIGNVESGYNRPDIRITVDTIEDYTLLCAVYDYLYEKKELFGLDEIIELFSEKPWLLDINKKIVQKKAFNTIEEEIREAIKILELQEMKKTLGILKNYLRDY